MIVQLTLKALADLQSIHVWIYKDNPIRADSFVSVLESACNSLVDMPLLFPVFVERRGHKIRRRVMATILFSIGLNPSVF
jgi:plasmid stabilization system protein ParE